MKFDTCPEIHCDECNEVVHNHFGKCPACGVEHAGTSEYADLCEMVVGDIIGCELCKASWKLIDKSPRWDPDEWEWERIADEG